MSLSVFEKRCPGLDGRIRPDHNGWFGGGEPGSGLSASEPEAAFAKHSLFSISTALPQ